MPIALPGGAWSSVRSHWYFPSPLFIAGSAFAIALVTAPVVVVWPRLWPLLLIWPVMLALVLLGRGTELRISPQGIELLGDQFPWDALELVSTPFGEALRTTTRYRVKHRTIYLWMYARKWRSGPIGKDVQAWAPELLDVDADAEAA
jgi:hypothetical protein